MQVGSLQEQVGQLTEKLESANQKTSETAEQVETLRQQLTNDASDAAAENQDLQVCTLLLRPLPIHMRYLTCRSQL